MIHRFAVCEVFVEMQRRLPASGRGTLHISCLRAAACRIDKSLAIAPVDMPGRDEQELTPERVAGAG